MNRVDELARNWREATALEAAMRKALSAHCERAMNRCGIDRVELGKRLGVSGTFIGRVFECRQDLAVIDIARVLVALDAADDVRRLLALLGAELRP